MLGDGNSIMPPLLQRRNAPVNLWRARRPKKGADAPSRPEDATCGLNMETAEADVLHFMEGRFSTEDCRGSWPAMRARRFSLGGERYLTLAVASRLSAAANTRWKFERQVDAG